MRILHLASHLNIGGVSSHLLALSQGLAQRGHRIAIAADGGRLEGRVRALGLTHWRVPLHTSAEFSPQVFWACRRLHRQLHRDPVDVIHAHTRVGQVAASRLAHRLGIPYVATWHGFFRRNLGRRLWPCTGERTIAISEPVRQHLVRDFHVPAARIRLIHNGVDPDHFAEGIDAAAIERFRGQWGIEPGRPTIGGVGRFASGRVKGFDLLLEASAQLVRQFPDLQVVLVGDGPRRRFLEGRAQRAGIRDRVHFVGITPDTRVPMAVMDVFAFSSRWQEGFGLSLIEAMAAGKPVVATPVGAVPEIVEHDRCGWLVAPESPAALAEGVARLLRDPATASRLGTHAQARVRERFSLEHMVDQTEAVYLEAIANKRPEVGSKKLEVGQDMARDA